jgi:hypothetical protein
MKLCMKLCIEEGIYFILKFHILETGTVKPSIETGLIWLPEKPIGFHGLLLRVLFIVHFKAISNF